MADVQRVDELMTRKIDISVTVSWTTPKGGKVEGVRHTTVHERDPDHAVRDGLVGAADGAVSSFRRMLALYEEDHPSDA